AGRTAGGATIREAPRMISPEYFSFRWSWYQPLLSRGEDPASRCRVDVRRLPLRMPGEDAKEYVPFAAHSQIEQRIAQSLRRLQDYAIRYVVKGEKVSAHKLPVLDARGRAMVTHLSEDYPHLPRRLLHHWCADESGAPALIEIWEGLWEQGWRQDQADTAPWVPAVNVLLLRLMRSAIASLPAEEEATTNHVVMSVVGGLYVWALLAFLKRWLEGVVEVTRVASYESMVLPATPMAFMRHQPDDPLLADDPAVIKAYGLEAGLIPRMRALREKVGPKNESGILALLGKDRMGAHMLQRTWARLSLWQLAGRSGNGAWMEWVLHAKRLDRLLAGQEVLPEPLVEELGTHRDLPVAAWLLARTEGGRAARKAGEPWLRDDISLNAFRVFEEDVKVEIARRAAERRWLDRRPALAGKGRGAEVDKALRKAWEEGELVFVQPDFSLALHSGRSLSLRQACLRIEWSDWLAAMHALYGAQAESFLCERFMAGVLAALEKDESVFVDEWSASGCTLRGGMPSLVAAGFRVRHLLREWYLEVSDNDEANMPALSMCAALVGDWIFGEAKHPKLGELRLTYALAVTQADAGVSRDCGVGRLIAYRDYKLGKKPLCGVRVERVDTGVGQSVHVLYNNGFALTAAALAELTSAMGSRASIREYRLDPARAKAALPDWRLPSGSLHLFVIRTAGEDEAPWLIVRAGKPCLGGVDVELYELLEPAGKAADAVRQRLLSEAP
ncbi:MAG: hypothetical protein R8K47_06600, partial [Mariprofundaceae bacterium]